MERTKHVGKHAESSRRRRKDVGKISEMLTITIIKQDPEKVLESLFVEDDDPTGMNEPQTRARLEGNQLQKSATTDGPLKERRKTIADPQQEINQKYQGPKSPNTRGIVPRIFPKRNSLTLLKSNGSKSGTQRKEQLMSYNGGTLLVAKNILDDISLRELSETRVKEEQPMHPVVRQISRNKSVSFIDTPGYDASHNVLVHYPDDGKAFDNWKNSNDQVYRGRAERSRFRVLRPVPASVQRSLSVPNSFPVHELKLSPVVDQHSAPPMSVYNRLGNTSDNGSRNFYFQEKLRPMPPKRSYAESYQSVADSVHQSQELSVISDQELFDSTRGTYTKLNRYGNISASGSQIDNCRLTGMENYQPQGINVLSDRDFRQANPEHGATIQTDTDLRESQQECSSSYTLNSEKVELFQTREADSEKKQVIQRSYSISGSRIPSVAETNNTENIRITGRRDMATKRASTSSDMRSSRRLFGNSLPDVLMSRKQVLNLYVFCDPNQIIHKRELVPEMGFRNDRETDEVVYTADTEIEMKEQLIYHKQTQTPYSYIRKKCMPESAVEENTGMKYYVKRGNKFYPAKATLKSTGVQTDKDHKEQIIISDESSFNPGSLVMEESHFIDPVITRTLNCYNDNEIRSDMESPNKQDHSQECRLEKAYPQAVHVVNLTSQDETDDYGRETTVVEEKGQRVSMIIQEDVEITSQRSQGDTDPTKETSIEPWWVPDVMKSDRRNSSKQWTDQSGNERIDEMRGCSNDRSTDSGCFETQLSDRTGTNVNSFESSSKRSSISVPIYIEPRNNVRNITPVEKKISMKLKSNDSYQEVSPSSTRSYSNQGHDENRTVNRISQNNTETKVPAYVTSYAQLTIPRIEGTPNGKSKHRPLKLDARKQSHEIQKDGAEKSDSWRLLQPVRTSVNRCEPGKIPESPLVALFMDREKTFPEKQWDFTNRDEREMQKTESENQVISKSLLPAFDLIPNRARSEMSGSSPTSENHSKHESDVCDEFDDVEKIV